MVNELTRKMEMKELRRMDKTIIEIRRVLSEIFT